MTEDDSAPAALAQRQTLSAQVAEKIYQRIRQQRLASGAILGTEAELADQFGVSRTVARAVNPREVQFHQLLFDIAGSQLTGRFHRLLIEYFYKAFQKGPFDQAPPVEKMRQHVELVEAIAARDLSRAIDILTAHIDLHLRPDAE